MTQTRPEADIVKNFKMIEWLKGELVANVAALLKAMVRGSEELLLDCLAAVIMTTYILARRAGIAFAAVDRRLLEKLRTSARDNHEAERWFGDLSSLLKHFEERGR